MVRDAHTMKIIEIILLCPVCKTDTKHVLTKSGDAFVCGCGNSQIYAQNQKGNLKAQQ